MGGDDRGGDGGDHGEHARKSQGSAEGKRRIHPFLNADMYRPYIRLTMLGHTEL